MLVIVRNNDIDQALRVFRKKTQREGITRDIRRGLAYEKPSERRIRKLAESRQRRYKIARRRM